MTYRRGDKIRTVLPGIPLLFFYLTPSYQYHTRFFSLPASRVSDPTLPLHTREKVTCVPSVSQRNQRVHHIPVAHQRGFSEGQQLTTGRNTGVV